MAKSKPNPIHPAIRQRLGFSEDLSDDKIRELWEDRANRVCKPCWELKYCPYGPLVEDSPLLPTTLACARDHLAYVKKCLETGMVGSAESLTDKQRELYEGCVENFDERDYEPDPTGELTAMQMAGHQKNADLTREAAIHVNEQMKKALETGIDGHSSEISEQQREMFEEEVANFDEDAHPKEIPREFAEMECTVFGHICPVIFNAEKITETTELRRTGRYIPFKLKIRVVRRDNYTCQHCGKHLLDTEVEFDHIIPLARGGSSEEHNIRLTCFECNRDKGDDVEL